MLIRIVLLVILLLFRFYDLGIRPPHHDEAVNGWFVDGIFSKGYYQYDPSNYHGPLFFYFLTFFEWVFGRSVESLRITPLLFGALFTASPLLFKKWVGERGAWAATFFLAVSPAMVFYSRYAIHEMMFGVACLLYFYFWIRIRKEAFQWPLVVGLGLSLGTMACVKENFIIYVVSLLIAEVITRILDEQFRVAAVWKGLAQVLRSQKFWIGTGAVLGISLVFIFINYSALGRDENGFVNFFRAFALWAETGDKGNGHQKPFFYWVNLLTRFEWMAMIGLVLTPFALKKIPSEIRLLSAVSFGLVLAYSIVNYKTPWCMLSFTWGLVLIFAYWFEVWTRDRSRMSWLVPLLFVGYSVSAFQAYDASYAQPDQDGHPYIYGQTYRDLMRPMNEIIAEGKARPELFQKRRIQVISSFTWPLPYILGEYKAVGYHGTQNAPAVLDADVLIIDSNLEQQFVMRIKDPNLYSRVEVKSRQWASPMVVYRKLPGAQQF